jgi:hypothetical protein
MQIDSEQGGSASSRHLRWWDALPGDVAGLRTSHFGGPVSYRRVTRDHCCP